MSVPIALGLGVINWLVRDTITLGLSRLLSLVGISLWLYGCGVFAKAKGYQWWRGSVLGIIPFGWIFLLLYPDLTKQQEDLIESVSDIHEESH